MPLRRVMLLRASLVVLLVFAALPGRAQIPISQGGTKTHPREASAPHAAAAPSAPPLHVATRPSSVHAKTAPSAHVGEKAAAPAAPGAKNAAKAKYTAPAKAEGSKQAPSGSGGKSATEAAAKPPPVSPPPEQGPPKGTATGLPLPRFAALRSDEVNFRAGPGTRYPIDWVYKRRDLPVEIEREFEVWRLVSDPDGVKGWVHQATLTGRRSFMVSGAERPMREKPEDGAPPVALVKPGVIGRILHCDAGSDWCRVQVDDYRGWLKRQEFWGSLEGEAIN